MMAVTVHLQHLLWNGRPAHETLSEHHRKPQQRVVLDLQTAALLDGFNNCSHTTLPILSVCWALPLNIQTILMTLHVLLFFNLRNITLLHYLITIVENKYPKVLNLSEELRDIPQAAKVK